MNGKKPDPVDGLIARNIRAYRAMKRVSQAELGKRIGVTAQQVQKYETGGSRICASRLHRIADALGVPVSRFFSEPDFFRDDAFDCLQVSSRR